MSSATVSATHPAVAATSARRSKNPSARDAHTRTRGLLGIGARRGVDGTVDGMAKSGTGALAAALQARAAASSPDRFRRRRGDAFGFANDDERRDVRRGLSASADVEALLMEDSSMSGGGRAGAAFSSPSRELSLRRWAACTAPMASMSFSCEGEKSGDDEFVESLHVRIDDVGQPGLSGATQIGRAHV